jgi:Tol biopolymer transport system component
MKRATLLTLVLVLSGFAAASQDLSDVFYKAVHLQDVKGDLEAAIPLFEKVVTESKDPSLAAKAQLRIGMCYEKLGATRALQAYQKVIDHYPRQSQEVAMARSRIAALSQAVAAGSSAEAAGAVVTRVVWTSADGVFTGAPSPDGKYITYTDWESGNLAVRDLKTETHSVLTNEGSWEPPEQFAEYSRWSPDGKQVVYAWWRGSEIELRVVSPDDRKPRVLFRNDDVTWLGPQDWSPDGRYVLASIARTGGRSELGLISVADGSVRSLETESETARFSPDGHFIVFDRPSGGGTSGDLFVMTVDGGREDALVKHPADDALVGWSPDGNWVLFCSDRTGTRGLWMLPVTDGRPVGEPRLVKASIGRIAPLGLARDGSFYYADVKVASDIYTARIDLTSGKVLAPPAKAVQRFEGSNQNPAYSPDGRYLAFISKRGQMVFPTNRGNALCVQPLGGGNERVFSEEFSSRGVRYIAGPRWAPDSRSILVAGWEPNSGIYSVHIETGKVELVVELPDGARLMGHEWARDGRGFFYATQDDRKNSSRILYRALQTGDERQLHVGPAEYDQIAASPDGRWLSFMSGTPNRVLRTMPTSGGTPREIYRFEQRRCERPEWTPDSTSITVICRQPGKSPWVLCRIPAEGGAIHQLGLEANISGKVSLHPDGQRIAFTVQNTPDSASDVWMISNFLPKAGAK